MKLPRIGQKLRIKKEFRHFSKYKGHITLTFIGVSVIDEYGPNTTFKFKELAPYAGVYHWRFEDWTNGATARETVETPRTFKLKERRAA